MPARAQDSQVDPSLYGGLHWRNVGPFRGGRSVGVSGVAGDPRTFYFGAVGGGVWKTTSAGRNWAPVMDAQPVASIGAVAVAPSDPSTVYVGSGEADMRSDIVHGNGMYRSTDAGASWTCIGLQDSRQIGRIVVDPKDPKTLLVAALGHAYGPNDTRGVYRSTDGGATWTRTLFHDRDTGAIDLAADPGGQVVFASLWQTRRPPWNAYPPSSGPGSGLYKSTDGGVTWNPVRGGGFPAEGSQDRPRGRAERSAPRLRDRRRARRRPLPQRRRRRAVAPRRRRRAAVAARLVLLPRHGRPEERRRRLRLGHRAVPVHRRRRDFTAIKGSPDGDDFHQLWIDPTDPARMALGSDQGTTVSLDGGATWTSWFNQPTGQFYHVVTDDAFPYHLYGAQQDSGAAMILARSDHRGIETRDWRPITAGGESGSIALDPRDRDVVYGNSTRAR